MGVDCLLFHCGWGLARRSVGTVKSGCPGPLLYGSVWERPVREGDGGGAGNLQAVWLPPGGHQANAGYWLSSFVGTEPWYAGIPVPVRGLAGRSEQIRRHGYASFEDACRARDELLSQSLQQRTAGTWTVGRWLRYWLTTVRVRPTTLVSYTQHVNDYLIPALGRFRLSELTGHQLTAVFAEIAAARNDLGRLRSPSTIRRVHATLRAALNAAVRDGSCQRTRPAGCCCRPATARMASSGPMTW